MNYNISYDIASLFLSIGLLIYYVFKKSIACKQKTLFGIMLCLSATTGILDIATAYINEIRIDVFPGYLLNIIYLVLFNSLPYIYFIYFLTFINMEKLNSWIKRITCAIPYVPAMVLVITTPFSGLIFGYSLEDGYCHGSLFIFLSVSAFIYMLYTLVLTLRFSSSFSKSQKYSIYFFEIGCLGSIIIQIFIPEVLVMQFCVALSLLLAYLATANLSDDEDNRFGIYNRNALIKVLSNSIEYSHEFTLLGINTKSQQNVREVLGIVNENPFMKKVISIIEDIIGKGMLFCTSEGQFVIYLKESDDKVKEIEKKLFDVFMQPIRIKNNDLIFDIHLFKINVPSDVNTVEDIMDILEMMLNEYIENKNNEVFLAGKETLAKKKRQNRIVHIMKRALYENSFQVFYQPILDVKNKKFHSAEALIRLIDKDMGFISPEEFIPLAEKKGLILDIGDFVFETVCRDIKDNKLENLGIDFVEVNLSVVQCMQTNLERRLCDIMEKYHIRPEQIDLEITETAMVASGETLQNNMDSLIGRGCTFAMDDYGTGFSNLSSMVKYPFQIVKLDKSMVWSAMEDDKAMSILKYSMAMLRALSIKIVAEGIETEEQADILEKMGCNYFQGYFYSKPLKLNDFLDFLRQRV